MGLLGRLRGKPSLDDFAAMLYLALRQAGDTRELRHDPSGARILMLDGGKIIGVTNLSNIHPAYLEKPRAERPAYLRVCVGTAMAAARTLPEDFEAARPDLRVKLWTRAMVEGRHLKAKLTAWARVSTSPRCRWASTWWRASPTTGPRRPSRSRATTCATGGDHLRGV